MSKVSGETKVMVGLLNKMLIHGTNDDEITRVKTYISKLHEAHKTYEELSISQIMKKYNDIERNQSIDIPPTVRRKAMVNTKKILEEVLQ